MKEINLDFINFGMKEFVAKKEPPKNLMFKHHNLMGSMELVANFLNFFSRNQNQNPTITFLSLYILIF
jgi:hypothetical protein